MRRFFSRPPKLGMEVEWFTLFPFLFFSKKGQGQKGRSGEVGRGNGQNDALISAARGWTDELRLHRLRFEMVKLREVVTGDL